MKILKYVSYIFIMILVVSSNASSRQNLSQTNKKVLKKASFRIEKNNFDISHIPSDIIMSTIQTTPTSPRSDDAPVLLPPPDINEWLSEHPTIAQNITWLARSRSTLWAPWTEWDNARKSALRDRFNMIWTWYQRGGVGPSFPAIDPIPYRMTAADETMYGSGYSMLTQEDAWDVYSSYVAHSLVIELMSLVPWSLTAYSNDSLCDILSAGSMFNWVGGPQLFIFLYQSTPATPTWLMQSFFRANSLLATSRTETIYRTLDWVRGHFTHFMGIYERETRDAVWQYRGDTPVSRIISGTEDSRLPTYGRLHYTAGCMGTVSFLISTLRAINIPARFEVNPGLHKGLYFPTENMHLYHGDDLYTAISYSRTSPIPISSLLVDQSTYDRWVSSDTDSAAQTNLIATQYLPEYLLMSYCSDQLDHLTHNCGRVAHLLSGTYTVRSLESSENNLWNRMDNKIRDLGGCDHISPPFPSTILTYLVQPTPSTCLP